jgi:uncharacterized heparinase superfamily protein
LELAGAACAGCLSFEHSSGSALLLVNAGTPGPADAGWRAMARATASHNTLCLGEQSSSKLVRSPLLERKVGGAPISHPDAVTSRVRERDWGTELAASHDGYVERFGLVHTRILRLLRGGLRLEGIDRLDAAKGLLRFAWDVPFAIHFHLHPDAEAHPCASRQGAELRLGHGDAMGEHWRLTAAGAAVSIEASVYFADGGGARAAQQVVLRGLCSGASQVLWTLERVAADEVDLQELRPSAARKPPREGLAPIKSGFAAPEGER